MVAAGLWPSRNKQRRLFHQPYVGQRQRDGFGELLRIDGLHHLFEARGPHLTRLFIAFDRSAAVADRPYLQGSMGRANMVPRSKIPLQEGTFGNTDRRAFGFSGAGIYVVRKNPQTMKVLCEFPACENPNP